MKKARLALDGVLLLDKSPGHSSNDALISAKRLLNASKAGHTGTLDPFATGLLPLCFGEATKFAQDLLDADKAYDTVVHLGVRTETGDTEGAVVTETMAELSREDILRVLPRFRGDIEQIPPMYSALKRDGKPLYEYARAGITLEREPRPVTIHTLLLTDFRPPFLHLSVRCSKGTYIRVLGQDIGEALGCGAHLNALRRTGVGSLQLADAHTLESFGALSEPERIAALAPVDALLQSFPTVHLPLLLARRFLQGQKLSLGKEQIACPGQEGRVRVYGEEETDARAGVRLLGTGRILPFGVLAPERLIAAPRST
ncbi:MAG: truB [Herminiimonas sp.]|nr:truB [Herminiimonas sp.]MDB5852310.1 truB [Herminiimonas sp.]